MDQMDDVDVAELMADNRVLIERANALLNEAEKESGTFDDETSS
jgi:hypothetical protein